MSELPLADKWAVQKLKAPRHLQRPPPPPRFQSIRCRARWTRPASAWRSRRAPTAPWASSSWTRSSTAATRPARKPSCWATRSSPRTAAPSRLRSRAQRTMPRWRRSPARSGTSLIFTVRCLVRQPVVSVRLQFPGEEGRADEQLEMLPGQPLRQRSVARDQAQRPAGAALRLGRSRRLRRRGLLLHLRRTGGGRPGCPQRAEVAGASNAQEARRLAARVPRRHLSVARRRQRARHSSQPAQLEQPRAACGR